jgi:hypothetical protein
MQMNADEHRVLAGVYRLDLAMLSDVGDFRASKRLEI